MTYNIDKGLIFLTKDCKFCHHLKVCKLHDKASELFKTKEFRALGEFGGKRDALISFEETAGCRLFSVGFEIPANKSVPENIPDGLMSVLVQEAASAMAAQFSTNNGVVEFKATNSSESLFMSFSEIRKMYKFD